MDADQKLAALLAHALDEAERFNAIQALRQLRDVRVLAPFLDFILTDPDLDVRREAAFSLGILVRDEIIPFMDVAQPLLLALENPDLIVRGRALAALARIYGNEQEQELVASKVIPLHTDPSPYIRYRVAFWLMKNIDGQSRPVAMALFDDPDGWVRDMAKRALNLWIEEVATVQSMSELMTLLADRNVERRIDAVRRLVGFKESTLLQPFLGLILIDPDDHVRREAIWGLGQLIQDRYVRFKDVFEALCLALDNADSIIRGNAVAALSRIDFDAETYRIVVEKMTLLLSDPSPYVRGQAAFWMEKLADKNARPSVIPLLDDRDLSVRQMAQRALKSLDSKLTEWWHVDDVSGHGNP